jgi:hypothetical protein
MKADTKEIKKWRKMGKSLKNYQSYISRKSAKYRLDLVDLLYISNFKGGNASIQEDESKVANLLEPYSIILKNIGDDFGDLSLSMLSDSQVSSLTNRLTEVCNLCLGRNTGIDGFKVSYFSALFHGYFPDLIPVLDRRILNGFRLIHEQDLNTLGQVKDIHLFYPRLVDQMRRLTKETGKSIRTLDGEYFATPFPHWATSLPDHSTY